MKDRGKMEKIENFEKFVKEFKKEIDKSKTIILTAHRDPDGDAIGSVLAMQEALQNIGKDVDIVLDEMPKVFLELKNSDKILRVDEFEKSNKKYDLAIFLDNNSKSNFLISDNILEKSKRSINIDHHIGGNIFTDIMYVEEESPAVCETVYKILKKLEYEITYDIMKAIIIGVITDTGRI